jgi:uncharacterized protein (TIGR02284 family)
MNATQSLRLNNAAFLERLLSSMVAAEPTMSVHPERSSGFRRDLRLRGPFTAVHEARNRPSISSEGVHMNPSNQTITDLFVAARDGKSFYEQAASKVTDSELKPLFTRLAKVKGGIVQSLTGEIRADEAKSPEPGSWSSDLNKVYSDVRNHLGEKNYGYVAKLEESEGRLLKAFERVQDDDATPAPVRSALGEYLPEMRKCHDILESRKMSLKHAA